VIKSFLIGAIAGGAAVWWWGDHMREALDEATSGVRTRSAERLYGVADRLQSVADTVDQGLSGTPPHVS
jgi:hypothetical protein